MVCMKGASFRVAAPVGRRAPAHLGVPVRVLVMMGARWMVEEEGVVEVSVAMHPRHSAWKR